MKQLILLFFIGILTLLGNNQGVAQSGCVGVQINVERHVSISGGSDGRINLRCVGTCTCSQGYLYSVNGGNFSVQTTYENLRAGDYTVKVLDRCSGCISTGTTVRITQPNSCVIVVATASRNVSTLNGNDGQITATCNGACFSCAAGYEYSLNGGAFQRTPLFNNLKAGQYKVVIRDRCSNCTNESQLINVTQPAGQPECAGVSIFNERTISTRGSAEGILVANCTGNCGNCFSGFQYALNGGQFQNSNRFTNLRAGTYTVTIKNTCNNCTTTSTAFTLTEPSGCTPVSANITRNITTTGGNDGSITASCVGLCNCNAGYQYGINNGTFQNSPVFNNLAAGTYVITLRDNCTGCTSQSNPIILSNPGSNNCATVGVNVIRNVTTQGNAEGEITASCLSNCNDCPAGFQYAINNGPFQSANRFTGLRAGVYTVTQRNSCNGCISQSNQVIITEPNTCVGVNAQVLNNASFEGARNGRILASCVGRCNGCNLGYEYAINGGTFQLSSLFPNLLSGLYTVSIRDLCTGCTSLSAPVFISQPSNQNCASGNATVVRNVSRNSGNDGEISAACNQGCVCNLGYEYSLNNAPYQPIGIFRNLRAGTYTVIIRDKCTGCISVTNTVTITEPAFVPCVGVSAMVTQNVSRPGINDGKITANCMGTGCNTCPLLGYSYSINGGTFQPQNIFNNLPAGTYIVTIRDNCSGCTNASMPVTITAPQVNYCVNLTVTNVINASAPNGFDGGFVVICLGSNCGNCSAGYEYSLNGGNYQSSNNFGGLRAGTYSVKIREKCTACESPETFVTITEPEVTPCPTIAAGVTKHASNLTAKDAVIQAVCSGNCRCPRGVSFSLNGGTFTNIGVFSGLGVGEYELTMRDNCSGCIATTTLTIEVNQEQPCAKAPGITRIQVNSGLSAVITWSTVPGALWYSLEYKNEDALEWTVIRQLYNTAYNLTRLTPASNYSIRVRAHCIDEFVSDYSPEGAFTTKTNVNPSCAAPSFRLTQVGADMIRLDWAPVLNAHCYIVSYRQTGEDDWTEFLLPATSRNHFFTDLPLGSAFQFRMKTNCTGCDLFSANESPYSFVLSYALREEIAGEAFNDVISVYPNPNAGKFDIRLSHNQDERITLHLTDVTGKIMLRREMMLPAGVQTVSMDESTLSSGVYLLHIETQHQTQTLKVVVN